MLCDCVDGGQAVCHGGCLTHSKCPGVSMTVDGGAGLAVAHLAALASDRSLWYGKPLIHPSRAAQEYLACILLGSLTGALPWTVTWCGQILSALAWAPLALLSDYPSLHCLATTQGW